MSSLEEVKINYWPNFTRGFALPSVVDPSVEGWSLLIISRVYREEWLLTEATASESDVEFGI